MENPTCYIQRLIPNFNCINNPLDKYVPFAFIMTILTFVILYILVRRKKK